MGDPMYTSDIFIDGYSIKGEQMKSEPMSVDILGTNPASASVPIPTRRPLDFSDLRDCYNLTEVSPCSSSFQDSNSTGPSLYSGVEAWSPLKADIKMEDDDIFQVDKADLFQGPTLAELNANDETLLEDLNFDDLLLPEDSYFIQVPPAPLKANTTIPLAQPVNPVMPLTVTNVAMSFPPDNTTNMYTNYKEYTPFKPAGSPYEANNTEEKSAPKASLSPASHHSSTSSLIIQTNTSPVSPPGGVSPVPPKYTSLHEMLLKSSVSPDRQVYMGQSVPGRSSVLPTTSSAPKRIATASHSSSRLCSSAPTHSGLEQIWQRREPRPHLLSTGSMAEATSTSSLSTGGILSPESHDFSLDECYDSDEDSDHYEDFSSDNESVNSDNEGSTSSSKQKKDRYFWQYNVQAKGPKGQRLIVKTSQEDPHCLNEVMDPVFSPECSLQGIKHSGKARKGDGNDLTPNPRKLQAIGRELDKLNKIINDMTPVSELPFSARPQTRKEKNKLASRACRLKKKAQHEANKIKLHGLECEHRRLMNGIHQVKQLLIQKVTNPDQVDNAELNKHIDKIALKASKLKIAGQTTEFVNKVLDKVKQGVPSGGLDDL